jgi:hypothetical protein
MKQELEHPFNWLAKKQHCTHFIHGSVNSSPANNSELLYDGSAEAREILRNASNEAEGVSATMVVNHALDYLKGKDIVGLASFTAEIMTPLDACEICKGASGGEPGNENVIDGVVMCDYCHYKVLNPVLKELEVEAGKEFFQQLKNKATYTELVQITPTTLCTQCAVPNFTFPDKACAPVKEAVFDGEPEDYPGWNPNSNEPKTGA